MTTRPVHSQPLMAEEMLAHWRARISPRVMRVFLAIAAPVIVLSVIIEVQRGQWQFGLLFALLFLLIAASILQNRTGSVFKALVMLSLMYLGGVVVGNLRAGLMSDGRIYALAIPLMATILIGLRAGWAMVVVSSLLHAAFGLLAASGLLARTLDAATLDMGSPVNWIYTGIVFFALMVINQWLISSLYQFTQVTLNSQREAFDQLEAANDRIQSINADLEDKNARLKQLARQLISAQEEERTRLARELHDGVLNQISSHLINKETSNLSEGGKMLKSIGEDLRKMVYGLRPPMLNQGLAAGLEELAADLRGRAPFPMNIMFEVNNLITTRYPEDVEVHVFRMVQEAAHNTLRHSRASYLRVSGRLMQGEIDLAIEDDGIGFDTRPVLARANASDPMHFGIVGLIERAALINASLTIDATSGAGARIRIHWKAENHPA